MGKIDWQHPPTSARRLYAWEANVTAIQGGKEPWHKWQPYTHRRQTAQEIDSLFQWPTVAYGVISGPGGWRIVDFDKCPTLDPVASFLSALDLSPSYPWIWRSGSANGFGVAVLCHQEPPEGTLPKRKDGQPKGVIWAHPTERTFDHLELRWKECQTLLPESQHPTGPGYRWLDTPPTAPPAAFEWGQVWTAVQSVAKPERRPIQSRQEEQRREHQPRAGGNRGTVDQVKERINLLNLALSYYPGETVKEDGETRILGHGGLLIDGDLWYCFADEVGGDCYELIGQHLYSSGWNRHNPIMFRTALNTAARFAGVELEAQR